MSKGMNEPTPPPADNYIFDRLLYGADPASARELESIVRALAAQEPLGGGCTDCELVCGCCIGEYDHKTLGIRHLAGCPWVAAVEWVAAHPEAES